MTDNSDTPPPPGGVRPPRGPFTIVKGAEEDGFDVGTHRWKHGLTSAEDTFCLEFVNGGNPEEAFERAFPEIVGRDNYTKIFRNKRIKALLANPSVIDRVNTLYARRLQLMESSAAVDMQRLMQELESARVMAMENGNAGAAVSATMGKAKIAGMITEKHQVTVKKVTELTDEELRFLLEGEYKDVTPALPAPVEEPLPAPAAENPLEKYPLLTRHEEQPSLL